MPAVQSQPSVRPFTFESYGVHIKIDGNSQEAVNRTEAATRKALLNALRPVKRKTVDQTFFVRHNKSGYYILHHNDEEISRSRSAMKFFKLFDSVVRATVGEHSPEKVFLHAGVVGWKGRAIVIPGDSFKGKSTLVAELVRQGAEYFSDDFAIFDEEGSVHPFPRKLAMRSDDGTFRPYELTVESLGMVLFTQYEPGKQWRPKLSTAGIGVLQMIPFALTFGNRPEFSLRVLNNIATRAIIASSPRGAAEKFAQKILDFVDKNVI